RKPPVLGCRREEVERMAPVGVLQMKEMVEVRARVGPVAGLILVGPESLHSGLALVNWWRAWTVLTSRGLKQL
ncbi:hypothetical protein Tco_1085840, partial [Tanacetum coccineum]